MEAKTKREKRKRGNEREKVGREGDNSAFPYVFMVSRECRDSECEGDTLKQFPQQQPSLPEPPRMGPPKPHSLRLDETSL